MEENRIPKRVLYMNLESPKPRYRWQDEVKENGRIVGGEEWQENVYNRATYITLFWICWKKYITERNGRRS
jgi:hypothetical protein